MAVKMVTPIVEIDKFLNSEAERVHRLVVRTLCNLGEQCIIEARGRTQEESWMDQTGNLRSSIGYVLVYDGDVINTSGFNQVKQGSAGAKEGRQLAEELARKHIKGYALIVVAGMNYAAYVEAISNKVVLTSAELFAQKELPEMMQKLKTQLAK